MNNPYRYYGLSMDPAEQPSVFDFDQQFEDWLEKRGHDADQILEIWEDLAELEKYAEEFITEMADLWDDAYAESAYERNGGR